MLHRRLHGTELATICTTTQPGERSLNVVAGRYGAATDATTAVFVVRCLDIPGQSLFLPPTSSVPQCRPDSSSECETEKPSK